MYVVWAIVVVLLTLAVELAAFILGQVAGQVPIGWISLVIRGIVYIGGILAVIWLVRTKLNKMPWAGMALPRPQYLRLLIGCLSGALVILAIVGFEYALGWLRFTGVSHQVHWGIPMIGVALLELWPSLGLGFCEELAFRGYVLQTLGQRLPLWAAILIMGVMFASIHFSLSAFSMNFVVAVILMSFMFAVMRFSTGSLWFPIGFHAMWDWTQTYLVGLSTTGLRHNPAIFPVTQHGSPLWVGRGAAIEGGLLYWAAIAIVTLVALYYARYKNRLPGWTRTLSADGRPLALSGAKY